MKKRIHIIIQGRVQGVCFRMYTCEEALDLGLTGWVRNNPDGTVEVTAEGEEDMINKLAHWCRRGPPHAGVKGFMQDISDATGEFNDFKIRH